MTFSFLADEHVPRVFIVELRSNGYDVASVGRDYEQGISDVEHLERSRQTGRIILSNDSDFTRVGDEYEHAGILLFDDQTMSVSAFVQGVRRVERFVPEDEFRGEIVWLDDWTE